MARLEGRVALVVGASRKRGIGRAIAHALARTGIDIVVAGTDRQRSEFPPDEQAQGWQGLSDVSDECRRQGVRSEVVVADVRRSQDAQRLIAQTVDRMGRLDILINNATYARAADRVPITELDDDLWRRIIDINLTGAMLCAKYAARQMIDQHEGGRIVGISSIAALTGPVNAAAYAASKAGVQALSACLAAELAPHGITSNVIAPGFIDTARIDELRTEERWQRRLSTIPMGRAGMADEVAELAVYLCGPNAGWLTGQTIVIDGGEIRR